MINCIDPIGASSGVLSSPAAFSMPCTGVSILKKIMVSNQVEVLAMAVVVEETLKLSNKDHCLRGPDYSIPLFVVTVGINDPWSEPQ
jgi:hypothetical protein